MYAENDPENIAYSNFNYLLFKMSISYTRYNKGSEKHHEIECVCVWGGGGNDGPIWPPD